MPKKLDLTGHKYGKLSVVEEVGKNGYNFLWLCICDCGSTKDATTQGLRSGHTKSCGCAYEDASPAYAAAATTHGMSGTVEYATWKRLKDRCFNPNNPKYHRYGGRGITMCQEWESFEQFYADMGKKPSSYHSIDRKDNNGPYSKDNCRWATDLEQANNKSTARLLSFNGRSQSLTAWAAEFDMSAGNLHTKLARGETLEQIAKLR